MLQGFETKPGTDHIVQALVASADGVLYKRKGPVVDMWETTRWKGWRETYNDPIAFFGILRGTASLIQNAREWYYFDHAYIAGAKHGNTFLGEPIYRLTKNWYHVRAIQNLDKSARARIAKYKGKYEIKPWQQDGKYILVCPPTPNMEFQFDKKDWLNTTLQTLSKYSDRPILIRDKYSEKSLSDDLKNAYAMVSCTTAVCIDAILAGVPSFCDDIAVGLPMSLTDFSKIETAYYPDDRQEWIDTLVANQFTMSEIKNGTAWEHVRNT